LKYIKLQDELNEARTLLEKRDRELKKKNGELRQASHTIENLRCGYQGSKDESNEARTLLEKHDRELKKKNGELRQASHIVDNLQQENKRSKDTISSLRNKLINVHQQLEDAKKPSGQPSARRSQPPPKDTYQNQYYRTRDELKQARDMLEKYDHRELKRKNGELSQASHTIENLRHGSKDTISSLKNELINVHQQLKDAKNLSEVHDKELVDSPALSISEVGEKVAALNDEIFQAALTAAFRLVRKRREVSQTDLEAAAAVTQEMVGEKMTKLLIAQSQKPEPEIDPVLVQVVLQMLLAMFCASKIQPWYPGDPAVGEIFSAIYSRICSTGKASH
jgi:chromosome segregation ATPase